MRSRWRLRRGRSTWMIPARFARRGPRAAAPGRVAGDATGALPGARNALGGGAAKPWRARAAERALVGRRPDAASFRAAADAALAGAVPRQHNAFKIELAKRTID